MKLKRGVCITGLRPELIIGLMAAETACREVGVDLVITSVMDGEHSNKSKHYAGAAADIRTTTNDVMTPAQAKWVVRLIKEYLPNDFDCILETNHIHLEFDPRRPT